MSQDRPQAGIVATYCRRCVDSSPFIDRRLDRRRLDRSDRTMPEDRVEVVDDARSVAIHRSLSFRLAGRQPPACQRREGDCRELRIDPRASPQIALHRGPVRAGVSLGREGSGRRVTATIRMVGGLPPPRRQLSSRMYGDPSLVAGSPNSPCALRRYLLRGRDAATSSR